MFKQYTYIIVPPVRTCVSDRSLGVGVLPD